MKNIFTLLATLILLSACSEMGTGENNPYVVSKGTTEYFKEERQPSDIIAQRLTIANNGRYEILSFEVNFDAAANRWTTNDTDVECGSFERVPFDKVKLTPDDNTRPVVTLPIRQDKSYVAPYNFHFTSEGAADSVNFYYSTTPMGYSSHSVGTLMTRCSL